MREVDLKQFQERLNETHTWPCRYTFKFIVPRRSSRPLQEMFRHVPYSCRESRGGKYLSLTVELEMRSGGEVVGVYREALKIEGIITL